MFIASADWNLSIFQHNYAEITTRYYMKWHILFSSTILVVYDNGTCEYKMPQSTNILSRLSSKSCAKPIYLHAVIYTAWTNLCRAQDLWYLTFLFKTCFIGSSLYQRTLPAITAKCCFWYKCYFLPRMRLSGQLLKCLKNFHVMQTAILTDFMANNSTWRYVWLCINQ